MSDDITILISNLSKLPGIGKKTAQRLAYYIISDKSDFAFSLSDSIRNAKKSAVFCSVCHNITTTDPCAVCSSNSRDKSIICVVSETKDLLAIEKTKGYNGVYHVLGGIISPMDGIGPSDLQIESLVQRVAAGEVKEVILALSATMEGDTTNAYIFRHLVPYDIKISVIARGVSIGDELEYADEITLGRSILNRTPYNDSFKR